MMVHCLHCYVLYLNVLSIYNVNYHHTLNKNVLPMLNVNLLYRASYSSSLKFGSLALVYLVSTFIA